MESDDAELARVARLVSEAYQYPVDSQVLSPTGEWKGQLCANELHGDAEEPYLRLLDAAAPARERR